MSDDMEVLYLDPGPVWNAAEALVTGSTLADHVYLDRDECSVSFRAGDVPIALWGDATQGLWQLLASIAHGDFRTIVRRCDRQNRAAIATSIAALCGDS